MPFPYVLTVRGLRKAICCFCLAQDNLWSLVAGSSLFVINVRPRCGSIATRSVIRQWWMRQRAYAGWICGYDAWSADDIRQRCTLRGGKCTQNIFYRFSLCRPFLRNLYLHSLSDSPLSVSIRSTSSASATPRNSNFRLPSLAALRILCVWGIPFVHVPFISDMCISRGNTHFQPCRWLIKGDSSRKNPQIWRL